MGLRVGAVEAHGDVVEAGPGEIPGKRGRAQDAVGLHVEAKLLAADDLQDLPDARVHERLAPRQLHGGEAERFRLAQDVPEQVRLERGVLFLFGLKLRREPAVAAPQVAPLGEVEVEHTQRRRSLRNALRSPVTADDPNGLLFFHVHNPPRPLPLERSAPVSSLMR